MNASRPWLRPAFVLLAVPVGVLVGALVGASNRHVVWMGALVVGGLPVVVATLRGAWRGQFAADLTATFAILGSIALGEPLAGLVIVLMQSGGEMLDAYATRRASRAVRALEARAPRMVHRIVGQLTEDIPAGEAHSQDLLLIRPGDIVACDGVVVTGSPVLDMASLTGEPLPITLAPGDRVRSGSQNLSVPFELRVTAEASISEYARIVDLVREAQASKAPLQRLADRYAIWFTPITLLLCAIAWIISGDPYRALAVLVVATPCPLILATPVAILGGINRAAVQGIVFRHGSAIEQTADITVVVSDKTGTLTVGRPVVAKVVTLPEQDEDQMLALAASVERGSGHLLAGTVVDAALERGMKLIDASEVSESPGLGIRGSVGGHLVAVGSERWIAGEFPGASDALGQLRRAQGATTMVAHITIDSAPAGLILFADRLRPGIRDLISGIHNRGIRRTVLLSGDATPNAREIGQQAGITEVHGEMTPADKADFIKSLLRDRERVMMIGDGLNDAPALSAATVGVALASGSGGITAEAADVVILADDPRRLVSAIDIARRTMRIAKQSIGVGLGLSAFGMILAAAGLLTPIAGAVAQEIVDLAVILNALRTTVSGNQPATT